MVLLKAAGSERDEQVLQVLQLVNGYLNEIRQWLFVEDDYPTRFLLNLWQEKQQLLNLEFQYLPDDPSSPLNNIQKLSHNLNTYPENEIFSAMYSMEV